ncbi:TetR family transcriptional regulator [Dethiosulfovibrio salsuginis]|uniref:Transcriptional regulator, TetR family n=1 Tax=Dethiosulfovibrio salsuginis TaxID=561720 RepID=A0A1X7K789_9BACT|nr:TetR family transcriptional regulator [Dethiosulfovibrio salsuginis]SMG36761.1 transcriptional regulator, TetR family [Dethiosulfovibrio salsuginis]
MARRTREEAAKTREKLLSVATDLFSKKGVDGVTLVEIGKEAGFTKGALYRHFGGKPGLLKELMDYGAEKVDQLEESCLKGPEEPLDRLRAMVMEEMEVFEGRQELQRILAIFLDRRSLAEDEGILSSIESLRDRTIGRIKSVMEEAKEKGHISKEIDLTVAAESLRLLIFGLMERKLYSSSPYDLSSQAKPMLELFFRALRP